MSGVIYDDLGNEIEAILSVIRRPDGSKYINSIVVPRVAAQTLYLYSDLYIYGQVQTPLSLAQGIAFGDGSSGSPSINFTNEPTLGLYRAAAGILGFASGGLPQMLLSAASVEFMTPITAPGDLTLAPAGNISLTPGGDIDCNGRNLLNVGNLPTNNPNYYVISGSAITTNATSTTVVAIPTSTNCAYTIDASVTATRADGSSGSLTGMVKASNNGGIVTVTTTIEKKSILDTNLAGVSINFGVVGTNVVLQATGLAGVTIKWFGASNVTKQIF